MISKEQIQRVHALVDKWGITDPIKQYVKAGEELSEMLAEPETSDDKAKELADYYFTLIALCYQLNLDFMHFYCTASDELFFDDIDMYEDSLTYQHLCLGGIILKGKDATKSIRECVSTACLISNFIGMEDFQELEQILIKNENKAGKTVNGTFIKEQDLK